MLLLFHKMNGMDPFIKGDAMETVFRVIYSMNGIVSSEIFTDRRSASNAARKFSKEPYSAVSRIYKCLGTSDIFGFKEYESTYVTTYKNGKRSNAF